MRCCVRSPRAPTTGFSENGARRGMGAPGTGSGWASGAREVMSDANVRPRVVPAVRSEVVADTFSIPVSISIRFGAHGTVATPQPVDTDADRRVELRLRQPIIRGA